MFTGKTRLLIQALDGRNLYEYGAPVEGKNVSNSSGVVSAPSQGSVIHALPVLPTETDKTPAPFSVGIADGVWLDPNTGKHWLIVIGVLKATAYPLVPTAALRAARKKLVMGSGLSEAQAKRLEAYVLAWSSVDVAKAQVSDITERVPGESMGYSWHWNWSGTAADIVVNQNATLPGQYTSRHYRLTHSMNSDGVWGASVALLETAGPWGIIPSSWSMLYPAWDNQHMFRMGSQFAGMTACDAPFYVFYAKDDLKLCRVETGNVAPAEVRTTSYVRGDTSYPYTSGGYGSPANERRRGHGAGGSVEDVGTSDYTHARFSVGGSTSAKVERGKTELIYVDEITDVVRNTQPTTPDFGYLNTYSAAFATPPGTPGKVYYGEQFVAYGGDMATNHAYYLFSDFQWGAATTYYSLIWTERRQTKTYNGFALVIVPYYDAEAIITYAHNIGTDTQDVKSASGSGGAEEPGSLIRLPVWRETYDGEGHLISAGYVFEESTALQYVPRYEETSGFGGLATPTETQENPPTSHHYECSLDSGRGLFQIQVPADFVPSDACFTGNDNVVSVGTFATISGTGVGADAMLMCPGLKIDLGKEETPVDASLAVVGWV